MKAGILLRVGIYLIGVWAFVGAMTDGVYYLFEFVRSPGWTVTNGAKFYVPDAVAHFFIPMGIALAATAFGGRIARLLLGASADEEVSGPGVSEYQMLKVGLKLLGVFGIVYFGPGILSSAFELFADAIQHERATNITAMRNLIFYVAGCGAGIFLCVKTRWVLEKILVEPERARP